MKPGPPLVLSPALLLLNCLALAASAAVLGSQRGDPAAREGRPGHEGGLRKLVTGGPRLQFHLRRPQQGDAVEELGKEGKSLEEKIEDLRSDILRWREERRQKAQRARAARTAARGAGHDGHDDHDGRHHGRDEGRDEATGAGRAESAEDDSEGGSEGVAEEALGEVEKADEEVKKGLRHVRKAEEAQHEAREKAKERHSEEMEEAQEDEEEWERSEAEEEVEDEVDEAKRHLRNAEDRLRRLPDIVDKKGDEDLARQVEKNMPPSRSSSGSASEPAERGGAPGRNACHGASATAWLAAAAFAASAWAGAAS